MSTNQGELNSKQWTKYDNQKGIQVDCENEKGRPDSDSGVPTSTNHQLKVSGIFTARASDIVPWAVFSSFILLFSTFF